MTRAARAGGPPERWGLGAGLLGLCLAQGLGAGQGPDWVAPAEERARTSPVPASPQALQKGRALYQRHCAQCHGDKGKGDGPAARFGVKVPEDLSQDVLQKRLTDGEIFWKLSTGLRSGSEVVMPGFSKEMPSEEDRWKVVLFLRSLLAPTQ